MSGDRVAVVADTREQTAAINASIRERLVAEGRVDDSSVATTRAGQRIGAGDRIATRRNDYLLGVANRDTWTVTAIDQDGGLCVTPADVTRSAGGQGDVTPAAEGGRVLPARYVTDYVELAYASTAHGVQGDTVTTAHVVIGEHTGAAATYVGMTRGRRSNTAHLIAEDLTEAREQWTAVFARDRADLGPAHAAALAAVEVAATRRPPVPGPAPRSLSTCAMPGQGREGHVGSAHDLLHFPRPAVTDRFGPGPPVTGQLRAAPCALMTNRSSRAPEPTVSSPATSSTPSELLTLPEAAELLRAPVATLRYWRHLGSGAQLPAGSPCPLPP